MPFKITFEYLQNIFVLEKFWERLHTFTNNFEIPLFLIKETHEQAVASDFYKYGWWISRMINRWGLHIKLYIVFTFVASSLVSFFNLLF